MSKPNLITTKLKTPNSELLFHQNKILMTEEQEINKGWTKIENEKDFPQIDDCDYWIVKNGNVELFHWPKGEILNSVAWLTVITHYQAIDKPELPIF